MLWLFFQTWVWLLLAALVGVAVGVLIGWSIWGGRIETGAPPVRREIPPRPNPNADAPARDGPRA